MAGEKFVSGVEKLFEKAKDTLEQNEVNIPKKESAPLPKVQTEPSKDKGFGDWVKPFNFEKDEAHRWLLEDFYPRRAEAEKEYASAAPKYDAGMLFGMGAKSTVKEFVDDKKTEKNILPKELSQWEPMPKIVKKAIVAHNYGKYLNENPQPAKKVTSGAGASVVNDVRWKNGVVNAFGAESWNDVVDSVTYDDLEDLKTIDTSMMTDVGKGYVAELIRAAEADKPFVNARRAGEKLDSIYKEEDEYFEKAVAWRVEELADVDAKEYVYRRYTSPYTLGGTTGSQEANDYAANMHDKIEAEALKRRYNPEELKVIEDNAIDNNGGVWNYLSNSAVKMGIISPLLAPKDRKYNAENVQKTYAVTDNAAKDWWSDRTGELKSADDWAKNSNIGTDAVKKAILDMTNPLQFDARAVYENMEVFKYMTEEELSVFAYLVNTRKGESWWKSYYSAIKGDVLYRRAEQKNKETEEYVKKNGWNAVLANAGSLAWGMGDAALGVGDMVADPLKVLFTGKDKPYDTNSVRFDYQRNRDTVYNATAEGIDNDFLRWAYKDVAMPAVENLTRTGVAAGVGFVVGGPGGAAWGAAYASPVLMSGGAYQSGVYDARMRGADNNTARTYGLMAAATEFFTERIGIENAIKGIKAFGTGGKKSLMKVIAASGLSNAGEEVAAYAIEGVYDQILMGENSKFNLKKKAYIDSGMSESEAFWHSVGDTGIEFLATAASGFATGGLITGVGGPVNNRINVNTVTKMTENFLTEYFPTKTVWDDDAEGVFKKLSGEINNVRENATNEKTVAKMDELDGRLTATRSEIIKKGGDTRSDATSDGVRIRTEEEKEKIAKLTEGVDGVVESNFVDGEWSDEKEAIYNNVMEGLQTKADNPDNADVRDALIDTMESIRQIRNEKLGVEDAGIENNDADSSMEDPAVTEPETSIENVRRALEPAIDNLSEGAWTDAKEAVYNNAINNLNELYENSTDQDFRNEILSDIERVRDAYVGAKFGNVMSIDGAVNKAKGEEESLRGLWKKGRAGQEAATDIEEQIRTAEDKRADLEKLKAFNEAGFNVKYFSAPDKSEINGVVIGNSVYVNLDGKEAAKHTVGHEFVHMLKKANPEAYDSYINAVMKTIDEDTKARLFDEYTAKYGDKYSGWNEGMFWEEYAADVAGDLVQDVTYGKSLINAIVSENTTNDVKRSKLRAISDAFLELGRKLKRAASIALRKRTGTYKMGEAASYVSNLVEVHRELLRAYHGLGVDNATADGIMESRSSGRGRKKIKMPYNEYIQLREYIMHRNNGMDRLRKHDCTEMGNNFYIWENYSKTDYEVFFKLPIVGNEDAIWFIREEIKNGTYGAEESIHTLIKRSKNRGKHDNSSKSSSSDGRGNYSDSGLDRSESRDTIDGRTAGENTGESAGVDEGGNSGIRLSVSSSDAESRSKEQDAAYLKAVERGDNNVAQSMVYEAAIDRGLQYTGLHGTDSFGFTKFDRRKAYDKAAFYFTNKYRVAETYSGVKGVTQLTEQAKQGNYDVALDIKKPLIIDCKGAIWNDLPFDVGKKGSGDSGKVTTVDVVEFAKKNRYDGVIFKNIVDAGPYLLKADEIDMSISEEARAKWSATVFAVFEPNQIKSLDAVTYDDKGNVIPLSKRFDRTRDDIRYSVSTPEVEERSSMENRAYEIENAVSDRLSEMLEVRLTDATKDAVKVYSLSRAMGDEARIKASLEKLTDSIIRNEAPVIEVQAEDDGFLETLRGVKKVFVSDYARQGVPVSEVNRTFGIGRWSGKEGLPVDVLYNNMVADGITLPEADTLQDKLIAIRDRKAELTEVRREALPRDEVRSIIDYAVDLGDYKTNGISEDIPIPEAGRENRVVLDEEFKSQRRALQEEIDNLPEDAFEERLRLTNEKNELEKDFVESYITRGKAKSTRGIAMDFCTMNEAEEAVARFRLKRSEDAAREARGYARENGMTQAMTSAARAMAEGNMTESELNTTYRNAADRVKIMELSELYKRVSYTAQNLKTEQRATVYEVCDVLFKNASYMKDLRTGHGQIDTFESLVNYICRVDSLKDSFSDKVPEDVRRELSWAAKQLNDIFYYSIQDNTDGMNQWKQQYKEKLKELGIRKRSAESAAAQALGEGFWNEDDLTRAGFNDEQRKNIVELSNYLKEMYKEILPEINKIRFAQGEGDISAPTFKVDRQTAGELAKMLWTVDRVKYNGKAIDNLKASEVKSYAENNDIRVEAIEAYRAYGVDEFAKHINWRYKNAQGRSEGDMAQWAWNLIQMGKTYDRSRGTIEMDYFPHLEKDDNQSTVMQFLNIKKTIDKLPTAISGMTESFKPNKKWSAFMQERLGNETEWDAMTGAERYLDSIGMYMYHASDITKVRILENYIREAYGNNSGDKYVLSNFAQYLRQYGDDLAGKQHKIDRALQETFIGRRMAQWWRALMTNISRNQLGANLSTAVTNTALYGQGVSWVVRETIYDKDLSNLVKIFNTGMGKSKEYIEKSTFLKNRFHDDVQLLDKSRAINVIAKIHNGMFKPMQMVDMVVSTRVHKMMTAVYMNQGMSEADAIENADIALRQLAASREYGEKPLIFSSNTASIVTKYTLEPLNQMRYYKNQFARMTQSIMDGSDTKMKATAKTAGMLMLAVAADALLMHLLNHAFKKLKGYPVVMDPVQMAVDAWGNLAEGDIQGAWLDVIDEVPIVNNIIKATQGEVTDMIVIGNLIDFVGEVCKIPSGQTNWEDFLWNAGMIFNPLGGTAQAKKMVQAYNYLTKGYQEKDGKVQHATDATAWDWTVGLLFGKSAIPSVQEWYDSGFNKLTKKSSEMFKEYRGKSGMSDTELYDVLKEYDDGEITLSDKSIAAFRVMFDEYDLSFEECMEVFLEHEKNKKTVDYDAYDWVTKFLPGHGEFSDYDKYYMWHVIQGKECPIPEKLTAEERKIAEIFIATGDRSVLIGEMSDEVNITAGDVEKTYYLDEGHVENFQSEYERILFGKISGFMRVGGTENLSDARWRKFIGTAKSEAKDEAGQIVIDNGWYYDSDEAVIERYDSFTVAKNDMTESDISAPAAFGLYLKSEGEKHFEYDIENPTRAQVILAEAFMACEEEPTGVLPVEKKAEFGANKKTYKLTKEQHEEFQRVYNQYYWDRVEDMDGWSYDDVIAKLPKIRTDATEYAKNYMLSTYGNELRVEE